MRLLYLMEAMAPSEVHSSVQVPAPMASLTRSSDSPSGVMRTERSHIGSPSSPTTSVLRTMVKMGAPSAPTRRIRSGQMSERSESGAMESRSCACTRLRNDSPMRPAGSSSSNPRFLRMMRLAQVMVSCSSNRPPTMPTAQLSSSSSWAVERSLFGKPSQET